MRRWRARLFCSVVAITTSVASIDCGSFRGVDSGSDDAGGAPPAASCAQPANPGNVTFKVDPESPPVNTTFTVDVMFTINSSSFTLAGNDVLTVCTPGGPIVATQENTDDVGASVTWSYVVGAGIPTAGTTELIFVNIGSTDNPSGTIEITVTQ